MAEKVRDYPKLAGDIVALVGGPENIVSATHCATRLRFILKALPEGAKEKISAQPGVVGVRESGGQLQVVIGTHVKQVYDALMDQFPIDSTGEVEAPKESIINRLIKTMSGVFAPFIYILAAAGILQGSLILIGLIWPAFTETGTYEVLSFMSWTPFTFLPIFIGITAAHHFKVNVYTAVLCTAALVNPSLSEIAARVSEGEHVNFLGIALSPTTYTSTVLPPLIMVWLLSYLERFLNRILPEVVRPLFTPFFCLLLMVPVTLLILGPISNNGAIAVAEGYNWLVDIAPPVAAAVVGGLWQVLVIFGFHWGITPVILANFAENGSDSFQAFQTAAVLGQVGAAFGVFLRTRNRELKTVAASASVTGIFGITEPAIYGVTLRLKRPFIIGLIAGAVGAIIMSFFGTRHYVYAGLPGPLTLINAHHPGTNSLLGIILGAGLAFFGAAIAVYLIGFKDMLNDAPSEASEEDLAAFEEAVSSSDVASRIASPLTGVIVPLNSVDDPVFASGSMGDGVAIEPTSGEVHAPFDGTVVAVLPSQHAIGLRSDDGIDLLIHVGLDTVSLQGKPFTVAVEQGDRVQAGDLLLSFDRDAILAAGLVTTTPVIITNSKKFGSIVPVPQKSLRHGDELMVVLEPAPASVNH